MNFKMVAFLLVVTIVALGIRLLMGDDTDLSESESKKPEETED